MPKIHQKNKPPDGQTVGYARPPIDKQFKPGKSGNPAGRPKGAKSIAKLFAEALGRRVTIQENGRPRKIRMQDLIIQGLVNDAARRERRAVQLLFSLLDRYGDGREQEIEATALSSDDEAIINRYLASAQAQAQEGTNDSQLSQGVVNADQVSPAAPTSHDGKDSNDEP
jgi:hypothetical protein